MKITSIKSHVLRYELDRELGYSQQYYKHRTAHLVEIETDEGITGWGECFGPGNIALANKFIVEKVIQPLIKGENPTNKEYIWQKVYNLLRDSGQKGMPIQALSGIDIALWDILSKKANLPLYQLIGGKSNNQIPVYGYGMMLQKKPVDQLIELFQNLFEGNEGDVISIYRKIYESGVDSKIFLNDFLEILYYFKNISSINLEGTNFSLNEEEFNKISDISKKLNPKDLILFWNLTISVIDELDIVSNQNLSVEMFLIRLIYLKDFKKKDFPIMFGLIKSICENKKLEINW